LAALVALAVGAGLIGAIAPGGVEAGGPVDFTFAVDCDTSDTVVDSVCDNVPPGAHSVNIALFNDSGAPNTISAFSFILLGDNTGSLSVSAPPSPNGAVFPSTPPLSFNCTLVPPVQDSDPSPTGTNSSLDCFSGSGLPVSIADGETIVLGTVSYTAAAGGATFSLAEGLVGDEAGGNVVVCSDPQQTTFTILCNGALVGYGQVAPADTPTPTSTPTNTATPTATQPLPTPCQTNCPTSTSLAFVTVTPTPGTPTAVAGSETPAPAPTEPGGTTPPGGGQQPGGGTGPGGGRPITLPDTGAGDGGGLDWSATALMALAAIAAGLMAGGVYYAAVRRIERNKGE